jgi:opacity protein-like surface antigen
MSRKLVVALAAALIGFGASAQAESPVKSSKSNLSEKAKRGGQGQAAKPTTDRYRSNASGRADCEY